MTALKTELNSAAARAYLPEQWAFDKATLPAYQSSRSVTKSGNFLQRIFQTLPDLLRGQKNSSSALPAFGLETDPRFVSKCLLPNALAEFLPSRLQVRIEPITRYQEFYIESSSELEFIAGGLVNKIRQLGYAQPQMTNYYISAARGTKLARDAMHIALDNLMTNPVSTPQIAMVRFTDCAERKVRELLTLLWKQTSLDYQSGPLRVNHPNGIRVVLINESAARRDITDGYFSKRLVDLVALNSQTDRWNFLLSLPDVDYQIAQQVSQLECKSRVDLLYFYNLIEQTYYSQRG